MSYVPEAGYILDAVIHGRKPGHTLESVRGFRPDMTASTSSGVIWALGGEYPYPTSPQTIEVLSTSTNDTAAGTGARLVLIQGLDGDWGNQIAVVALNGTTPASASGSWLRINHTTVLAAGSGGRNAGSISVRIAGGDAIRLCSVRRVHPGRGRQQGLSTHQADDSSSFLGAGQAGAGERRTAPAEFELAGGHGRATIVPPPG